MFLFYLPLFWVAVFVIMILIEALSMQLTTVWCALASIPLIVFSFFNKSFELQLIIFLLISIILFFTTRPFALKKLKIGSYKTNIDTLINQKVKVVSKIEKFSKGECETENGIIWSATSENGESIEKDSVCTIIKIKGNTLVVTADSK